MFEICLVSVFLFLVSVVLIYNPQIKQIFRKYASRYCRTAQIFTNSGKPFMCLIITF